VLRAVRDEPRARRPDKIMVSVARLQPIRPSRNTGWTRRGGGRGSERLGHQAPRAAHAAEAIRRVVTAGVRTIEHGNLIDEPTARLMAEKKPIPC
jgi:hypothetical protein